MIRSVIGGAGITIKGNPGYPYISPGSQSAGLTRYNTSTQNLEVYDGNAWLTLSTVTEVSLDNNTIEVLNWARKKMQEETQLAELMKKHPGLQDLHEKFELMKALCQSDKDNATR